MDRIQSEYKKLTREQGGLSDVAIASRATGLGIDLETFKVWVKIQAREGKAVLSTGDWSLSSEEVRAGAIESRGRQYLLVRFKKPAPGIHRAAALAREINS